MKAITILGIRGIPAAHGGFETFAEHLALYLVDRGWSVTVYCQEEGEDVRFDEWRGVKRVKIGVSREGALGTVLFDLQSIRHARRESGVILTLGYNTAIFSLLYFGRRVKHAMNMDGIEWRREKWSRLQRLWLFFNEWSGCYLADHLIADHPEIGEHLSTRTRPDKIDVIPYGADALYETPTTSRPAFPFLEPNRRYALIVARPEPENSILEIVRSFARSRRECSLVVLGKFDPERNSYHRTVLGAASEEIIFPGAIYDKKVLSALRRHCILYIHGHTVGGTNPSLVEALGAGSPVLAHNNPFNRWVARSGAAYFSNEEECAARITELLGDDEALASMAEASKRQHSASFTWPKVLRQYEELLLKLDAGLSRA